MGSFSEKQLRASLVLPQGTFPGTNNNTLVLTGLRMSAQLEQSGRWTNSCDLRIWGMRQDDMNAVTVVFGPGGQTLAIQTALLILESNDGSGWFLIFQGQLIEGGPDYSSIPDVCLHVLAMTGAGQQWLSAAPNSFRDEMSVVSIANQLTQQMGFILEPNDVTGTLSSPYFDGTLLEQFRDLAEMANFDYYFLPPATIAICSRNKPRLGKTIIPVNPQTGLVGYPTRTRFGVECTVLFSPAIELGAPIQISNSTVRGADGVWYPFYQMHDLESITPGGRWFSQLRCGPAPLYASASAVSLLTASGAL